MQFLRKALVFIRFKFQLISIVVCCENNHVLSVLPVLHSVLIRQQQHPLQISVHFLGDLPSSNPWYLWLEHASAEADGKTLTGLTGIMIRAAHLLIIQARKYQAAFSLVRSRQCSCGQKSLSRSRRGRALQTSCALPAERGVARAGHARQDKYSCSTEQAMASLVSGWPGAGSVQAVELAAPCLSLAPSLCVASSLYVAPYLAVQHRTPAARTPVESWALNAEDQKGKQVLLIRC